MKAAPPFILIVLSALASACADSASSRTDDVILATTTSVEDSGLLEELAADLHASLPRQRVRVIAVGSGQALELARRGDADLVLVHAPEAEAAFVAAGHGEDRRTIMRNDFVLLGPVDDPASVRGAADAYDALRRIARARELFLSRGDASGTHRKERTLWDSAGVRPAGDWYREAGVGQADLLRMASERGAYTLADRATFRFLEPRLHLAVVHSGGAVLDNPYSLILATRARNPAGARAVADWLAGDAARAVVGRYGTERFGTPLFQPVP